MSGKRRGAGRGGAPGRGKKSRTQPTPSEDEDGDATQPSEDDRMSVVPPVAVERGESDLVSADDPTMRHHNLDHLAAVGMLVNFLQLASFVVV